MSQSHTDQIDQRVTTDVGYAIVYVAIAEPGPVPASRKSFVLRLVFWLFLHPTARAPRRMFSRQGGRDMRVWLLVFITACLGCKPLYVVESSKRDLQCRKAQPPSSTSVGEVEERQSKCEDRKYKTIGLYHLPRTDLRVDAALRSTHIAYGEHYCFAKALEMGEGKCRPGVCSAEPMKSGVLRSLAVTPVTVPDTSDIYAFKLRDKRRAVKRTSTVQTESNAVLTGADASFVGAGKVALTVVKGFIDTVAAAFGAAAPATEAPAPCATARDAAKKAERQFKMKRACRNALTNEKKDAAFSKWSEGSSCKRLLEAEKDRNKGKVPTELAASAGVVIGVLNEQITRIEAKFGRQASVSNYTVQEWIQVERIENGTAKSGGGPAPIILGIGKEQSVGLCDYRARASSGAPGSAEPSAMKEPAIRLCRHGDKNMFVEVYLTPPPEMVADFPEIDSGLAFDPQQERRGLVYRLPRTLLLHAGVRPEALWWRKEGTKAGDKEPELVTRQVKAVAFSQLGTLLRAPNTLSSGNAEMKTTVSKDTGMLTKIEVSKEPQIGEDALGAALSSLTTAAGLAADRPEPPTETQELKDKNLLACETKRHECLEGMLTGQACEDMKEWCYE